MSAEEEMECQSLPIASVTTPYSSARRHSTNRRRGRSLASSHTETLKRNTNRGISTPRRAHHGGRGSSSSSILTNENNVNVHISLVSPSSLSQPQHHSRQAPVRPLPFECSSDDEQHQQRNAQLTTRSGKMKKDEIFSYFSLRPDARYDCNICHQPYTAYNDSATNLRRHLFVKHDITTAAYESQISQIQKRKLVISNETATVLSKSRKKQLDKMIVDCIIDDSLPFTTFTKPGMINLLKTFEPQYEPISRFTIASRVDTIYHKYIDEVKAILQRAPSIAFTADIWKSGARKYYISLTAHLFDKDFEVVPLVLSLRQLTERHLTVNIQSFIMFELDEKFQITLEQRAGITTDCGREMVAATLHGLFGQRYACIAHVWNNVVKNGLCLWSPPNPTKFPVHETDVDFNESIQSIGGDEDDLLDDEERQEDQVDNDETPETNDINSTQSHQNDLSTSTATLSLKITMPMLDEFLSENDEPIMIQPETRLITLFGLLERTFNLLNRCRQLVQDMRNIGVVQAFVSIEIGKKGRGVTLDMEIRWNSTFQMLDRLLEHQTLIDTVVRRKFDGLTAVQANRLKLAALTPDDWDVLRALHHVLFGFDAATTIISASHYPTLSDSFWAITKLRQILVLNKDNSRYTELFKKSALNYLDIYVQRHLSQEQQEGMLIAAFLDPETHNDLNEGDLTHAMEVIKHKIKNISTNVSSILNTTTTSPHILLPTPYPSSSSSQVVLSKKHNAKQLMNRLAGISTNQSTIPSTSVDVEISLFLSAIKTKSNFKQFWSTHRNSFPRLLTLVYRFCLVPATSVASESAFSIAGFVARKQRSSLSSRTLRHLLVLKYRKNLKKFQEEDEQPLLHSQRLQALSLDSAGSTSV